MEGLRNKLREKEKEADALSKQLNTLKEIYTKWVGFNWFSYKMMTKEKSRYVWHIGIIAVCYKIDEKILTLLLRLKGLVNIQAVGY